MLLKSISHEVIDGLRIVKTATEEELAGVYIGEEKALFQLPPMRALFGISERSGFYSMALSLDNFDEDEEEKQCLEFFKIMEHKFYGDESPHSSVVRTSKGNYPPYLNLKLPTFLNGEFITKVFYDNPDVHMASPCECIQKGDTIIPIVQCNGFWKSDNSQGANWDIIQIKLTKPPCAGVYKWL